MGGSGAIPGGPTPRPAPSAEFGAGSDLWLLQGKGGERCGGFSREAEPGSNYTLLLLQRNPPRRRRHDHPRPRPPARRSPCPCVLRGAGPGRAAQVGAQGPGVRVGRGGCGLRRAPVRAALILEVEPSDVQGTGTPRPGTGSRAWAGGVVGELGQPRNVVSGVCSGREGAGLRL